MKSLTIRIAAGLWQKIRNYHLSPGKRRESLSYLYGRVERVCGGWVLLLPEHAPYFPLADDCFESRSGQHVRLRNDVLNGMLRDFAGTSYNCLINIHDHWFSDDAVFSRTDDVDDAKFDQYLRREFEPMLAAHPDIGSARGIHNLSLVLGQRRHSARLIGPGGRVVPVRKIMMIGEQLQRIPLSGEPVPARSEMQQRHHHLEESSMVWSHLHVGIAGCGGLGVIMAEALARMGVGQITLVDSDRLDTSNLNRWQGAIPADVSRPKASLLAKRLRDMVPGLKVKAVLHSLDQPSAQSALAACDVLIGGLDNALARFHLNQLALGWLQPYFDAGVVITTHPGVDFRTRYFAVVPGVTGCARCKHPDLINMKQVTAALASPTLLAQLRARGYVADDDNAPAASAYRLNMRAAGLLLGELENHVAGWRPLATLAVESWQHDSHQRLDREKWPEAPAEDCPECSLRIGQGHGVALVRRSSSAELEPLGDPYPLD